jgi:hypothetical protein
MLMPSTTRSARITNPAKIEVLLEPFMKLSAMPRARMPFLFTRIDVIDHLMFGRM